MSSEYVVIQMTIKNIPNGIKTEVVLLDQSINVSEHFKDDIWDEYTIDIDKLPTEFKK